MSVNVITLGKEGKLEDPDKRIDYLMCSFFFSKYSQSTLYQGRISSLTKIIQEFGNNPVDIRGAVESKLQVFLAKYFTTASVECTVDEDGGSGIKLQINPIVSDTESLSPNSYSVGYSLLIKDSQLKSITNSTNGTQLLST